MPNFIALLNAIAALLMAAAELLRLVLGYKILNSKKTSF